MQNRITKENNQQAIGEVAQVLIEHPSAKDANEMLARSSQDKKVALTQADSEKVEIGDMVTVKLDTLIGDTFRAKLCTV